MEYISYSFDFTTRGYIRGGETSVELTEKLNEFLKEYSFKNNVYDGSLHIRDNNDEVAIEVERGSAFIKSDELKDGLVNVIRDYLSSK
jgi:hypothetical protein